MSGTGSRSVVCKRCGESIGQQSYVTAGNLSYHSQCFVCSRCGKTISGQYVAKTDGNMYHPDCAKIVDSDLAIREGRVCIACGMPCVNGRFITISKDEMYHAECFVCVSCKKPVSGEYVPYGESKEIHHPECARRKESEKALRDGKVCKGCQKACVSGKIITLSETEMYHARCFKCTGCKKLIEGRYSPVGIKKLPYHLECAMALNGTQTDTGQGKRGNRNISRSAGNGSVAKSTPDKPRTCKGCGKPCDVGKFMSTATDTFHADCFRCASPACGKLITAKYAEYGQPPRQYHPECGKQLFAPRCCLCTDILEGKYFRHPYFDSEMYCMSHETRQSCFACGRKEPLPGRNRPTFLNLWDGRLLCLECRESAVLDTHVAVTMYQEIVRFMEGVLGLSVPPQMYEVPVLLVDVHSLNENRSKVGAALGHHSEEHNVIKGVSDGEERGSRNGEDGNPEEAAVVLSSEGVTRGLTLSTCQEVRHVSIPSSSSNSGRGSDKGSSSSSTRNGKNGVSISLQADAKFPSNGSSSSSSATLMDPSSRDLLTRNRSATYRITQKRDVTAVLVLYGLPRDLVASIIAHEAMHVWLKLNKGFPFKMAPKIEEGLCQVIAFLYLDSLIKTNVSCSSSSSSSSSRSNSSKISAGQSASRKSIDTSTSLLLSADSKAMQSACSSSSSSSSSSKGTATGNGEVHKRSSTTTTTTTTTTNLVSSSKKPLIKLFYEQIKMDKSAVYGDGFKEAHRAVSAKGLKAVLSHIQRHQTLPK